MTTMIRNFPLESEFEGNARNLVYLCDKNHNTVIVAHHNTFKGVELFSIRELWLNQVDQWSPGKGVQIAATKKQELLTAIAKLLSPTS